MSTGSIQQPQAGSIEYPTPLQQALDRERQINRNLQRELTKALESRVKICPACRERYEVPE